MQATKEMGVLFSYTSALTTEEKGTINFPSFCGYTSRKG